MDQATLSAQDGAICRDFLFGALTTARDEAGAAFGWNRAARIAAGSAARRMA